MKYGAVVFDMDGVLFDSEALVLQCWMQVGSSHQLSDVEMVCRQCLGTNAAHSKAIFQSHYGEDFPYDIYKQEMSALYWTQVEQGGLQMKPGVRQILSYLGQQHCPTAIASSTRSTVIRKQLGLFGLEDSFEVIIGGEMVRHSKPHPEIYLTACRALGVPPADAFGVEDSYNGIRASHAAGMRPVMIPDLLPPTEEMEGLTERIFADMPAFQEYLCGETFSPYQYQ